MKRRINFIRGMVAGLMVLLMVPSCMKYDNVMSPDRGAAEYYENTAKSDVASQAVGTVKSREGVRYVQLDAVSAGFVVNPAEIQDIPDGTRVFLQYRTVVSPETPDFCSDAILVEWASPLDMGVISYAKDALKGDPVAIVTDWITCLEDGFLTLHYSVPSKGKAQHTFALYPGATSYDYRLVHDAHGDVDGDLTDGIVCFEVAALLPETGEKAVTLSLEYLDIDHTWKKLTVEYRSPK